MAWIQSHQTIRNHPKVKKAARLLRISEQEMIGYLHYLWWWAIDHAQDGDLTGYDPLDIEGGVDWNGEPGTFYDVLLNCGQKGGAGLIEETPNGLVLIHDWYQYYGRLIERRQQDAERKRAGRALGVHRMSTGHPTDIHVESAPRVEKSREEKSRAETEEGANASPPAPKKRRGSAKPKQRAAYLDHPAVIAYQDAMHLTPNEVQGPLIVEGVTDLSRWQSTLENWLAHSWNPRNVPGMLDAYRSGNGTGPPHGKEHPMMTALHMLREQQAKEEAERGNQTGV